MEKEKVVYLYEIEELLGGEGLSTYDLTLIASKNIKWHEKEEKENNEDNNSATSYTNIAA